MHFAILLLLAVAGSTQAYTVAHVGRVMYKNVDAIVMPVQYKSHLHTFFGSDAVTATTSTSAELQEGCTTAFNPNDFSSYYVPTLLYTGGDKPTPVPIFRFSAYYNLGGTPAEVPIPQNYKTVAGDSKATNQAGVPDLAGVEWFCEGGSAEPNLDVNKDKAAFPSSTCGTHLQTHLLFHNYVNEETLESAYAGTHNWNATFRSANSCPEGMKRMPQLRFSIRYDLRKIAPNGWFGEAPLKLSSENSYSSHGDFINGWLPEAAEHMVNATSRKRHFFEVIGSLGGSAGKQVCADPTEMLIQKMEPRITR